MGNFMFGRIFLPATVYLYFFGIFIAQKLIRELNFSNFVLNGLIITFSFLTYSLTELILPF